MIYLLDDKRYWTEYLEGLLDDPEHFSIVRSFRNSDTTHELFNKDKHKTILSAGYPYDETKGNLIICRYHHSPGFSVFPIIEAYFRLLANHPESDFRLMVFEEHFKALVMTESLPEKHDLVRYEMIQDFRVSTTKIDPMAYKILKAPKKGERDKQAILLSPSWLIAKEGIEALEKIVQVLAKDFKVTLVLHPLTEIMGEENFFKKCQKIKGIEKLFFNLSREEMIALYDTHAYIATGGSGSCYEAMLRGCTPLLISNLSYQKEDHEFHYALRNGYLPFQEISEIKNLKSFDPEPLIKMVYPFLSEYDEKEGMELFKEEILVVSKG